MKKQHVYPVNEQEAVSTGEPTFERLLDVEELSEWLGIEQSTIYAWTSKKMIPHIKLGKKMLRFRLNEIHAWLAEKSVNPNQEATNHIKRQHRSFGKSSASDDYVNRLVEEAKRSVSRN